MRVAIGAADREWIAVNLPHVRSLAQSADPEASVYAVRATVFVETSNIPRVAEVLARHLRPHTDYRWMNIGE